MSEEQPIVLPGLAASKRTEPSAVVCANGHVLSWFVDPGFEIGYCGQCGGEALFACPACNAALPPDPEMLKWVPYYSFCASCGKPYPWIAADVDRARRTIAELAHAEHWKDEVRTRADALIDAIVAGRATSSEVIAGVKWLEVSGAEVGATAILDTVARLANNDLKTALRPSFPGLF